MSDKRPPIPERPSDSAEWMNREGEAYGYSVPLFPSSPPPGSEKKPKRRRLTAKQLLVKASGGNYFAHATDPPPPAPHGEEVDADEPKRKKKRPKIEAHKPANDPAGPATCPDCGGPDGWHEPNCQRAIVNPGSVPQGVGIT